MATYNKFNQTIDDIMNGVHDFQSDTFRIALCAAANAPVATNAVKADLTEIAYTNVSGGANPTLTTSTASETSGTWTQLFADLVITASGGAVAAFRYVVIYNDTPTSPADPLVCYYDYGSNLTLADGETLTLDFTGSTFTAS